MADMDFEQTIGIAPQFSSYALDERQVLLLSEQRSFRLTGKLYVALLPFLDGSRTGQAVVQAFEGRFDGARLRTILGDMFAKGYITQLDARRRANARPCGSSSVWCPWRPRQSLGAHRSA
jgi:ribosomal protein S12 methylthiotransferase accessory factor